MTQNQYTLAELLDLQRQFKAYGALIYCPADHAHEDDELNYEVVPAPASTLAELKELNSECRVCGREMHASYDDPQPRSARPEASVSALSALSMRQHQLRMALHGNLARMRREWLRSKALMNELARLQAMITRTETALRSAVL